MPRVQGTIAAKPPLAARKRFGIASTVDGYEVVDNDTGRAMTESYTFSNEPLRVAADLNDAAHRGPRSLAIALGAIDPFDVDALVDEEIADAV